MYEDGKPEVNTGCWYAWEGQEIAEQKMCSLLGCIKFKGGREIMEK